jgi:hypothetical protein
MAICLCSALPTSPSSGIGAVSRNVLIILLRLRPMPALYTAKRGKIPRQVPGGSELQTHILHRHDSRFRALKPAVPYAMTRERHHKSAANRCKGSRCTRNDAAFQSASNDRPGIGYRHVGVSCITLATSSPHPARLATGRLLRSQSGTSRPSEWIAESALSGQRCLTSCLSRGHCVAESPKSGQPPV